MNSRYPLALIVVAATFLGASCALQASETDDRIETSAKTTYVYRTYLQDDDITIQAKDGIVTLTGTVADESHRMLAQDTVEGLPGVQRVDNRLDIKGEKAEEKSDTWIAAKVKASLWFHNSVARKTDVYVKDGVVTLNGTATSQA